MVDPYADDIELVPSAYEEWRKRFVTERERIESALAVQGFDRRSSESNTSARRRSQVSPRRTSSTST